MNWEQHKCNFKELQHSEGITVKLYAERYDLNYNTARRYLAAKNDQSDDRLIKSKATSKPSKLGQEPKPIIPANKASKSRKRGNGEKVGAGSKAADHEGRNHVIDSGKVVMLQPKGHGTRSRRVKGDKSWKNGARSNLESMTFDHNTGEEVEASPPERDPARRVRSGIYQKLTGPDIQAALDKIATPGYLEAAELDALATAIARRDMLVRIQKATMAELDIRLQIYNGLLQPGDDLWDDLGENPKNPIFEIHKLNIEGGYALADAARTISQIRQNIVKERVAMWKLNNESHRVPQLIDEALKLQEENEWSDVETAKWLERRGVKVPATLLFGAVKELKDDDGIDDDGETMTTVDPEKVEEEARKYAAMRAGKEAFLLERRQTVAGIVDRGGYGDIDEEGQRREGEGMIEYDDEEIDQTTLHQQFEDDAPTDSWDVD